MGEILLEWARNIIFFMVFLSVISHLLADASYEKYIRFCRDRADPDHSQPLKRRSGLSGESRKVFEEFSFSGKGTGGKSTFKGRPGKNGGISCGI